MRIYNSARLLRAACKAIEAVQNGERCTWHTQAFHIVESLRNSIRHASTYTEIEKQIIGSDIGFLSGLVKFYPWLLDGTGFQPKTGRPQIAPRSPTATDAQSFDGESKP